MGWSTGMSVADCVWSDIKEHIKPGHERQVAEALVDTFQSFDCDEIGIEDFGFEEEDNGESNEEDGND